MHGSIPDGGGSSALQRLCYAQRISVSVNRRDVIEALCELERNTAHTAAYIHHRAGFSPDF